jgi:hypothetical protein
MTSHRLPIPLLRTSVDCDAFRSLNRWEITSRDLPMSDPISIGLGSTEAAGPATATTWLTVQAVNGSLQYLPDTVLVKPGRYVQVSTVFMSHAQAPSRCGAAPTAAPTKPGVTNAPIRSTAAPTMQGTLHAIRTHFLRHGELHGQIGTWTAAVVHCRDVCCLTRATHCGMPCRLCRFDLIQSVFGWSTQVELLVGFVLRHEQVVLHAHQHVRGLRRRKRS